MASALQVSILITFIASQAFFNINATMEKASRISKGQLHIEQAECNDSRNGILLNFRKAGLQRIDSDFVKNSNVSCLNLENNEIIYVSPAAFRNAPILEYLNLARNKISLSNFSELESHPRLRTLYLDENEFGSDLMFSNEFPSLTYLFLRSNGIKNVAPLTFAPNLEHLILTSNNLGKSDLSFFDDVPKTLTNLHLESNGISKFNGSKFEFLRVLNLDDNAITRICGELVCEGSVLILKGAEHLEKLSLSRNALSSIDSNAFNDTKYLMDLDLSYNQIEKIWKNTFVMAGMLRNLSLKGNLFKKMPDLYGLFSVEHLSLANNQLEVVTSNAFETINNLRFIDLSNNNIRLIEPNAFRENTLLRHLDLSNNKLTIFPNMWLSPLEHLKVLNLRNNEIKTLEDIKFNHLRSNTKLKNVFLQNNFITNFYSGSLHNTFKNMANFNLQFADDDNRFHTVKSKCNCTQNNNFLS